VPEVEAGCRGDHCRALGVVGVDDLSRTDAPRIHAGGCPDQRGPVGVRSPSLTGTILRLPGGEGHAAPWVRQAERGEGKRPDGLASDEREELRRLRRENQTLRMERDPQEGSCFFARQSWPTRGAARSAIFECIEGWYNPRRRHPTLGYLSPIEFERQQNRARPTGAQGPDSGQLSASVRVVDPGLVSARTGSCERPGSAILDRDLRVNRPSCATSHRRSRDPPRSDAATCSRCGRARSPHA
jgi:Integrase core domain